MAAAMPSDVSIADRSWAPSGGITGLVAAG
jgi:hypothetical protein